MSIFNYKGLAFAEHKGENYHVLTMNFIDYNNVHREITITWNQIGRKSYWLAQLSGLTTEYTGSITEVLDKIVRDYDSAKLKQKGEGDE